jgi:16S rRNA (guanine966-N2)-methyltransferase
VIQKNLELCRFSETAKILRAKLPEDLRTVAKRCGIEAFDLIFVDPPYDKALVNPALRRIAELGLLADGGRIIVEHSPRERDSGPSGFSRKDQRNYGQTVISFLDKVSGPVSDPSLRFHTSRWRPVAFL